MEPERWIVLADAFEEAVELDAAEQPAYLRDLGRRDPGLRREVEALLEGLRAADGPLEEWIPEGRDAPRGRRTPRESRLGPYRLLEVLADGRAAVVYRAVLAHPDLQQPVALKVIRQRAARPDLLSRFRTERRVLATLRHRNIARLLHGGSTRDGLPYFAMEYIEGEPIDRYCDLHRLSLERRIEIFLSVCSAVHAAHQSLVVHRDLKPSNILVTREGVPKLLDFGIAKLLNPPSLAGAWSVTETGLRPMTPLYASPEQVAGEPITTATDVYALGVLLYELLTGGLPHPPGDLGAAALERAIREADPEPLARAVGRGGERALASAAEHRGTGPRRLLRALEGDLEAIVTQALRKEPARRYPSVDQLAADLRRHLERRPVLARGDSLAYRARRLLRRHRAAVIVASSFVVLVLAFAAGMAVLASRLTDQRDALLAERERSARAVEFLEGMFELSEARSDRGETVTVSDVLLRGAERADSELQDRPALRADLLQTIGTLYRRLGLLEPAEQRLRQAVAIRRAQLTDRPGDLAESLDLLASLATEQGRYEEAGRWLEKASLLESEAFGGDEKETRSLRVSIDHHRGELFHRLGDYDEAERYLRRSIDRLRRHGETLSPELATQLMHLALVLQDVGRLEDAEALFREALALRQTLFGEEHLAVAESLNALAVVLAMSGRIDAATPMFHRVLATRRSLLSEGHPDLADSLHNMGRLHEEKGESEAARRYYREALAVLERAYGPDHPEVAFVWTTLGFLDLRAGHLAEAQAALTRSLAIRRRALPPGHVETGVALLGLGAVMAHDGRPAEAEPLLREAESVLSAALPADHWRVAEARSYLGWSLALGGRSEEAEPLLRQALRQLEASRGADHPRTRAAADRLTALVSNGR